MGFIDGDFAAIPYVKGFIIIYKGAQMEKVCRTEKSARKYIAELKQQLVPVVKPAATGRQRKKKVL